MKKPSKGLKEVNGIWHIDIRDGKERIRESTKTDDLALAEQRLAQLKTEIFERRYIPKAQKKAEMTLQQGFDKALRTHWTTKKSPETPEYNYNRLVGIGAKDERVVHLDPQATLSEISKALVWDAIGSMREVGYPDSTINRSMSALRKILTLARDEWEVIESFPKVPHFKESRGRIRFLQDELGEEQVITDWFRAKGDIDMAEFIEVLLDTGCRVSEVLKLEPKDVQLFTRKLMLWNTKNGEWAAQDLPDRSLQIFTRRYKLAGSPFEGLTRHAAIHRFQTMKKHCGFENDDELCLHTMRHTTASRLVISGMDIRRVQHFMRHENIETTLRYAKLNDQAKKEGAQRIDELNARPKRDQNVSKTGLELVKATV
jgi:site-specific recombinase XerD